MIRASEDAEGTASRLAPRGPEKQRKDRGNMKQTESEQRLHSVIIPCYKSDQTIRKVVELTMAEF